jgi:hypothetical protein
MNDRRKNRRFQRNSNTHNSQNFACKNRRAYRFSPFALRQATSKAEAFSARSTLTICLPFSFSYHFYRNLYIFHVKNIAAKIQFFVEKRKNENKKSSYFGLSLFLSGLLRRLAMTGIVGATHALPVGGVRYCRICNPAVSGFRICNPVVHHRPALPVGGGDWATHALPLQIYVTGNRG